MAAPNLVGLSTVTAKVIGNTVPTTATAFLTNPASSGKVYKVNTIMVTNSNTVPISVTLDLYRSATPYYIGYGITVPVGSTVVLLAKDNSIYMEEDDSLRANAVVAGLYTVTSYEVIG